ncbi:fam-a protein [Plasmodium vinckei brucechwatti]|uniref:Fam-a protein n=1 Tax=Plasmodium vinckei brucechwatti TaxID=119398 RepID=A0A6V7SUU8_PLAVN|nr:fam-a protein [Plasmodium vinckei brucechwatti]
MNRFYIQIVLFLLSASVYLSNKALATQPTPRKATEIKSKNSYATSEEIFMKNRHLLCTDPVEIKHAENLIRDAVKPLKHHAKNKNYQYECAGKPYDHILYFENRLKDNLTIKKMKHRVNDSNKYNGIINDLWDPNSPKFFDTGDVKRKIVRVYSPNLVMIQQRYKSGLRGCEKYFYALVGKFDISKDVTVIAMASGDINDHHPSKKEYKNRIIKNAKLFKTDIDSENDIRNGKLKKTFLNIGGYYVENTYYNYVDVTYVESIDGNTPF